MLLYLVAVSGVGVSEALDVVKHEPGQRDDHEDDEGDGDEDNGGAADVFLEVPCSYGDVHGDGDVSLQEQNQLTTLRLWNHDGHHITSA